MNRKRLIPALILIALSAAAPALAQPADPRIPVKTQDDLPRYTYHIEGKASEFVVGDKFAPFAAKIAADAKSDLEKYKIEDATALQGYYTLLANAALLDGKFDEALTYVGKSRDLEKKESKKLTTGLSLASMVVARKAAGADDAKFSEAFRADLEKRVRALPWDVVKEDIIASKGRAEFMSRNLIVGQIQSGLDPIVEKQNGEVSQDIARGLLGARALLTVQLPLMKDVAAVYGKIVGDHETSMTNIWTDRAAKLDPTDKATPVVVCIWDSGVDVSLFSGRMWVNEKEKADGKDNDGNGFVDDVNGIAYDLDTNRVPELLHSLKDLRGDKKTVTGFTKGFSDLNAGVESPEAVALKKHLSGIEAGQVNAFIEDLSLFGNYSHGTHVAGLAQEGNPFIRLLPIRITFDFRQIPTNTPTVERAEKEAQAARDCVAYMKAAGVRVTNMSWGGSRKSIEDELEAKGAGKTPAERAELSRRLFKIQKDALEAAMKSAPEILFVVAAGNSDNNVDFSEIIPSGIKLPNMITVGAVDKAGKPTSFTSFGGDIKVYADGFEVESVIPGGEKMKYSGTSMASPNCANLAAKLIALNPKLTTAEVIDLIVKGGDPMEKDPTRVLINPKKSVEMLRAKK